jgi:hypothetical protein
MFLWKRYIYLTIDTCTSGKPEDWAKFKATRKTIKKTIECEHNKYIADILNIVDDITEDQQTRTSIRKKFWRYIKSKKQESSDVATLEVDGCYMEDIANLRRKH